MRKYSFSLSIKLVCDLSTKVHLIKDDDARLLAEEFGVPKEKIVKNASKKANRPNR